MPLFDEWGLRPVGLEEPRESPIFVFPLPAATSTLTLEAGAGRRAPSNASEVAAKEATLVVAPEVTTPGAWVSSPEAADGGPTRSEFPGWKPPRLGRAVLRRRMRGRCSLTLPRSSPLEPRQLPQATVVRKRKVSPSCNGDAYRTLKQRKYIAKDE